MAHDCIHVMASISQKSCVFKWIFKKMILKNFYDVIFLEKIFKSRFLKNSKLKIFFFFINILVLMYIYWLYRWNSGKLFLTFSPVQERYHFHTSNRTAATTNGPISLAGAAGLGKYGYGYGFTVMECISGTVL